MLNKEYKERVLARKYSEKFVKDNYDNIDSIYSSHLESGFNKVKKDFYDKYKNMELVEENYSNDECDTNTKFIIELRMVTLEIRYPSKTGWIVLYNHKSNIFDAICEEIDYCIEENKDDIGYHIIQIK